MMQVPGANMNFAYVPPRQIPVAEASKGLSKCCREVTAQQKPVVITNHRTPMAAIVPLAYLENQNSLKIKAPAAFEYIGQFVCKVHTGHKSCSGIIFDEDIIAVPWHAVLLADAGFVEEIRVCYAGEEYRATWHNYGGGDKLTSLYDCAYHDICFFKIEGPSREGTDFPKMDTLDIDNGPINSNENDLSPGEKVFCAYYLDDELTYHEGKVSSVDDKKSTSFFSVDLPVVPQSSGGAVFVSRFGSLRLLGLIIAQYASIQSVFADAKTFLVAQDRQSPSKDDLDHYIHELAETVDKLANMVLDNIATGIAKVIHAKHLSVMALQNCCSYKDDSEDHKKISFLRSPIGLMPTAKQEPIGVVQGEIELKDGTKQKYTITCTGNGNGKVDITYSKDHVSTVITYKFKKHDGGNRHEVKGYDNADKAHLHAYYQEMAKAFDTEYKKLKTMPDKFFTTDFRLEYFTDRTFNRKQ